MEAFLRCGDPHFGFFRIRCYNRECPEKTELILPYSCRGRGLCPSCGQRRAIEWAERMVEEVLPETVEAEEPKEAWQEALERLQAHPLYDALSRCVNGTGRRAAPDLRRYLERGRGDAAIVTAQVLHDLDPGNRKALEVLPALGVSAASAAADIIGRLKDPDEGVRAAAARALGAIGPDAPRCAARPARRWRGWLIGPRKVSAALDARHDRPGYNGGRYGRTR